MNKRLKAFLSLKAHPWLGRSYGRLTAAEIAIAVSFINDNADLSRAAFELKVNRMFLDKEKPRHWREISELLTCCNGAP